MTSSLLACVESGDETAKSQEERHGAPLFQPAPGLYYRPT